MDLKTGSKKQAGEGATRPLWWVAVGVAFLCLMSLASLLVGPVPVDAGQVWAALFDFDSSDTGQVVVRQLFFVL